MTEERSNKRKESSRSIRKKESVANKSKSIIIAYVKLRRLRGGLIKERVSHEGREITSINIQMSAPNVLRSVGRRRSFGPCKTL